jgi:alpha-L-fucosidase
VHRRSFLTGTAASLVLGPMARRFSFAAPRPVPSAQQLTWHGDELALFLHFGVNTFTDREWGDGSEDPAIFNPAGLDARQWTRVAKDAGFKLIILTAKHHDGFCLWPSKLTTHSVASSPWRQGGGDVVREFTDACRAEGLKAGLYLSPWDRHEPSYGDSPRYNDFYIGQLTELLTQYGPITEVWFDGANGEGPNGKRQVYDWPRIHRTVRELAPHALMFSDAGPDIRWIGNERGTAGDPTGA